MPTQESKKVAPGRDASFRLVLHYLQGLANVLRFKTGHHFANSVSDTYPLLSLKDMTRESSSRS